MKIKDLREKSDEELKEMKKDLEMQLIKAKVLRGASSKKGSKRVNYKIFRELRKHVARILTILNERKNEKFRS